MLRALIEHLHERTSFRSPNPPLTTTLPPHHRRRASGARRAAATARQQQAAPRAATPRAPSPRSSSPSRLSRRTSARTPFRCRTSTAGPPSRSRRRRRPRPRRRRRRPSCRTISGTSLATRCAHAVDCSISLFPGLLQPLLVSFWRARTGMTVCGRCSAPQRRRVLCVCFES